MEPISNAKFFGQLVLQRRKALGLRQRDLALAANVGERMVVDLEAGKKTCQLEKALAIAWAVGIRLVDAVPAVSPPEGGYDLPDMTVLCDWETESLACRRLGRYLRALMGYQGRATWRAAAVAEGYRRSHHVSCQGAPVSLGRLGLPLVTAPGAGGRKAQ